MFHPYSAALEVLHKLKDSFLEEIFGLGSPWGPRARGNLNKDLSSICSGSDAAIDAAWVEVFTRTGF